MTFKGCQIKNTESDLRYVNIEVLSKSQNSFDKCNFYVCIIYKCNQAISTIHQAGLAVTEALPSDFNGCGLFLITKIKKILIVVEIH